jgi:hypothetical protein
MRRRLPWLLGLPLMIAGSLMAHIVGRLISSVDILEQPEVRESTPLRLLPILAAFMSFALVVGGAWLWSRAVRRPWRGVSATWFLIAPPVAYALGEWAERLLHGTDPALHEAHDANIAVGLLLQVPFALLAYVAARTLLIVGRRVISALRRWSSPPRLRDACRPILSRRRAPLRRSLHAVARSVRGPPPLTA